MKLNKFYAKIDKNKRGGFMKIFLDRIAKNQYGEDVATFELDGVMVNFGAGQMPSDFVASLIPNAIVECDIVDGCIVNPVILFEETKQKEEEMKKRRNSLFKRKNR